ncbi:hypothetical protein ACW2AE_03970 [Limosilactobacillus fermentum]
MVQLPAGLDPDEYVQANGQAKFQEYLAHAEETPTAFRLHFLKQGLNLANQSELLHYVEAALREVAKVTDPVERDLYIQQLAKDYPLKSRHFDRAGAGTSGDRGATPGLPGELPSSAAASRDAALSIHAPHHNYRAEYPGATAVGEGRIGSATAPAGDVS